MTTKTRPLFQRMARLDLSRSGGMLWVLAALVAGSALLLSAESAESIFDKFTYWSLTATCGVGGYLFFARFPTLISFKAWVTRNRVPLAISAIGMVVIALSVPREFRDLINETNLLNVANSFFRQHAPRIPTAATYIFDNFNSLGHVYDQQPVLFSYLTQLLHLIRGVHFENAFYANLLIWFGLLFALFRTVARRNSITLGIVVVLAMLGQPILVLQATSAGPELLFLFLFLATLFQLRRFLVSKSREDLIFLWLILVWLAMSHTEAAVISMACYVSLFTLGYIDRPLRVLYGLGAFVASLLFYPMLCQQMVGASPIGFSLTHFLPNLKNLASALFDVRADSSFSKALVFSGALSLLWIFKSSPREKPVRDFRLLATLALGLQLALILCRGGASATNPVTAGLYLPIALLLALSPVVLRRQFHVRWILPVILANFLWYHPLAVDAKVDQTLVKNRELRGVKQFVDSQKQTNIVVVSERPSMYAAFDYGAFDFEYARRNELELQNMLKLRYVTKIYVVQTVDSETSKIPTPQSMSHAFTLTPVKEFLLTESERVRISELAAAP